MSIQHPYSPDPHLLDKHRANRAYWRAVRMGMVTVPRPAPVTAPKPPPVQYEDGLDFTLGA